MPHLDVDDLVGRFRDCADYFAPLFGLEKRFDYKLRLVPRDAETVKRAANFTRISFVGDLEPGDAPFLSVNHYYKDSLVRSEFAGEMRFPHFSTAVIIGNMMYEHVNPNIRTGFRELLKGVIYHGGSQDSLKGYSTLVSTVLSCAGFAYAAKCEEKIEILLHELQCLGTSKPIVISTDTSTEARLLLDIGAGLSNNLAYVLFCREGSEIIPHLVHLHFKDARSKIQKLTTIDITRVDEQQLEALVGRRTDN